MDRKRMEACTQGEQESFVPRKRAKHSITKTTAKFRDCNEATVLSVQAYHIAQTPERFRNHHLKGDTNHFPITVVQFSNKKI